MKQRPRKGSPRKKQGLSGRERKAVAGIVAGKTKKQALLDAGYSASTADKSPDAVLGKSRVQNALLQAYEKQGLTEEYLAKKTKELCEATDVVTFQGVATSITEPNWTARSKGIEIAHKCRGDMREKVEVEGLADAIKGMADDALNARIVELLGKMKK